MNLIKELRASVGAEPTIPAPPQTRPVTVRVPEPHVALADAIAAHLGKTRSAVLGGLIPEALEAILKELPSHLIQKLSGDAMVINLTMLRDDYDDDVSPEERNHFDDILCDWKLYNDFDVMTSASAFDMPPRPPGLFDYLIPKKEEAEQ